MSKKAGRLGDIGSSHSCFPPTPTTSGSPDVLTNDRPAIRVDDPLLVHACGNCPPHPRAMAQGSSSVLINGKPACRVGDEVNCGGVLITGSSNVLIGEYRADDEPATPSTLERAFADQVAALSQSSQPFCEQCPDTDD